METLHPSEIDLGLSRVKTVADRLGCYPSAKGGHLPKVITVAGTNGKGSFVEALAELMAERSFAVGTYTSPHFICYNERVRIKGEQVGDEALCESFEKIDRARGDISLTYFEFGTLAAFDLFSQTKLDFWVLEIGLGGRLDAVNVIDPDMAVITPISLDHEKWLGYDRESIAREKAGILRQGIPVLCADDKPPKSLIALMAQATDAVYRIGNDFGTESRSSELSVDLYVNAAKQSPQFTDMSLPLLPVPSVVAAVQAAAILLDERQEPDLNKSELSRVFKRLKLPGRYERRTINNVDVILDVAHNPAAASLLEARLSNDTSQTMITYGIVAMMADKKIDLSLQPLISVIDQWICVELNGIERAAKAQELKAIVSELTDDAVSIECSCAKALENLLAENGKSEYLDLNQSKVRIVVFGSFYTVAEASLYLDAL